MKKLIVVQPFDATIMVFNTKKSFNKYIPDTCLEGADGFCCELRNQETGGNSFGVLVPKDYNEEVVNHEALHLVHMLLDYHGIAVSGSMDSSELQCYMQAHVVREIQKAFFKNKL